MENNLLVDQLDNHHNENMIEKIHFEIGEAKEIIEQKEKEYKDVLKVKACKEEYENIAKEINTYPRLKRIQEKSTSLEEGVQHVSNELEKEIKARKEQLAGLISMLDELQGRSNVDIINAGVESV
mmetsp:Transcript_27192/g.24078  ORF Transcript_27192/g.24078 Transcript_27192/m.24078 type:complete len:125 (+) Transcript_27192:204-578(+)